MTKVLISREASQDPDLIYDKIAQDNPAAAQSIVDEALKLFARLGRNPELGRRRPFPKPFADLRSFTIVRFSNYVVFYRLREDGVEVVRVLPGARQFEAVFGDADIEQ